MSTDSEFSSLFRKYVDGTASADERMEFLRLVNQEGMQGALAQLVDEEFREGDAIYSLNEKEQQEILTWIYNAASEEQPPVKKLITLWRIAGIAAAVATVVFGVWFFNSESRVMKQVQDEVAVNDVAPGKYGATLTLANGKTIQLSDAKSGVVIGDDELVYNDGTALQDEAPDLDQYEVVASTARGQTYEFTLPDGTHVWLNAESKISFPSQFIGNTRKVLLSGEAYFEVAKARVKGGGIRTKERGSKSKEQAMPFIVESKGQQIEVLGTHFNVNAYADEPSTKTTLIEGSVRVSASGDGGSARLRPNHEASLGQNFQIRVKEVTDAERAMAWRNKGGKSGELIFEDEELEPVMRKIMRWYDVEVVYRLKRKKPDVRFSGVISRDVNLSKMTKLLEHSGSYTFKIEGRRLIVMD